MIRSIACLALMMALGSAGEANAGPRTVTLGVDNMTCASCPFIVRKTLSAIPGVERAEVTLADHKAVVTFDDGKTNVAALTEATAKAGFPSRVLP